MLGFLAIRIHITKFKYESRDFPGGPVAENSPANAGDMGLIPGLGGSHMHWSNSDTTQS